MLHDYLTWQYLTTMAGCSAVTGVVTHLLKGLLDRVVHIPTQLLAYPVALAVLLLSQAFTGELQLSMAVLDLFESAIVASCTSGSIDTCKRLGGSCSRLR